MLPRIHSSCYTGSAEAGVEGRSPPRTCTASPRVGLPSDDEENQQRVSILTDYDHAGPNCSSGDDLLINISRTGSDHGSRCDDVGLFREAELAKRRRNVLKRFSSIGSGDQVGNQIFVSHCWRSGDPARQKRKFDLFSSLTQARRVRSATTCTRLCSPPVTTRISQTFHSRPKFLFTVFRILI
jgi:uncharacterized protein YeeX (DUF496 family)